MEWFYHDLAGIQVDPAASVLQKIIIKPTEIGDVTWAKADYQSISGLIRNHWALNDNHMTMDVTLPARPIPVTPT